MTTHRRTVDQLHELIYRASVAWWRLRYRGGDFRQGESSPRAENLTALWDSRWSAGEPIGHHLRCLYPDRWVRFHLESEPDDGLTGRRVDEGPQRYLAVLADLLAGSRSKHIVVIGEDWKLGGWTREKLPGAWPWRSFIEPGEFDPGDPCERGYLWVSPVETAEDLEPYFRLIENDEISIVVTDAEMTWVFAPYDRGMDVFLPDSDACDRLKHKHEEWLSPRPDGL